MSVRYWPAAMPGAQAESEAITMLGTRTPTYIHFLQRAEHCTPFCGAFVLQQCLKTTSTTYVCGGQTCRTFVMTTSQRRRRHKRTQTYSWTTTGPLNFQIWKPARARARKESGKSKIAVFWDSILLQLDSDVCARSNGANVGTPPPPHTHTQIHTHRVWWFHKRTCFLKERKARNMVARDSRRHRVLVELFLCKRNSHTDSFQGNSKAYIYGTPVLLPPLCPNKPSFLVPDWPNPSALPPLNSITTSALKMVTVYFFRNAAIYRRIYTTPKHRRMSSSPLPRKTQVSNRPYRTLIEEISGSSLTRLESVYNSNPQNYKMPTKSFHEMTNAVLLQPTAAGQPGLNTPYNGDGYTQVKALKNYRGVPGLTSSSYTAVPVSNACRSACGELYPTALALN
jgi:hypothetical protein